MNHLRKKIPINKTNIAVAITILCYLVINVTQFNKSKIFLGDAISYYSYLPALIIYNDLTLDFAAKDPATFENKMFYLYKGPDGNYLIKASSGVSIMLSPFFLMAHTYASLSSYEANGFTRPYKIAIMLAGIFYMILALVLLSKTLAPYFPESVVAMTILLIGIGTNLLCYATLYAGVSHVYAFVLICSYLFLTIKWHENPKISTTIMLGLIGGLAVLIRPTNVLIVIFLIFYNIKGFGDLIPKIKFFLKNYLLVLIMLFFSILVWVPQFLYWHEITGTYVLNSYGYSPFHFDNPQVISQLFSYRKGWLLYTPIMVFSFFGLYSLYKYQRQLFWPVLLLLSTTIYVLSSWYSWWFAGSFGSRGYIDFYGILALPIAAFVYQMFKLGKKTKLFILLIGLILISLNIVQTLQYTYGYIHQIAMTKKAYWAQFLRFELDENFHDYLLFPNYRNAMLGIYDTRLDYTYEENDMLSNDSIIGITMKKIRESEPYMELIREKAKTKGVSVEKMLWLDAQWIIHNKLDKEKNENLIESGK